MPKNGRHHLEHPRCGKYDGGHRGSGCCYCHIAMGLGTAFGGGIVQTWGCGSPKLKPVGGFAAETAGATTLAINSVAGIPVSTTRHYGAIVGVGATMKLSSVRWGIAGHSLGLGAHDSGRRWCSDRHVVRALCTRYSAPLSWGPR